MNSSLWRLGITLALLGFASILPATAGAQPPPYLTQWGSSGSGPGQFSDPQGIATDATGNVYVADRLNSRIQKFTSTGAYLTEWGSYGNGPGQFDYPWAVATDAAGNVYVADQHNNRIQKFTSTGTYLTQWSADFYWPRGVATDAAGDVYVADSFNFRVQKFTGSGAYLTQWGSIGSGDGQFYSPQAIATDPAGNVFVAEGEGPNQRIQKFTGSGTFLTKWGSPGRGDGQFVDPYGMGTDAAGNVYVADTRQHRVQKFTNTGTYLTQWGIGGSGNGEFIYPVGVATDDSGNVYVLDQGNNRVQKFGPTAPPPPPPCEVIVAFDFKPNTLNLRSMGRWVSGRLEPPAPYTASDIDVASIRLNHTVPVDLSGPVTIGDENGNGISDLKVKFSRAAVQAAVAAGGAVPVGVSGDIGAECFTGGDVARMIHAPVTAPAVGELVAHGLTTPVRWQTPPNVAPHWVAVLASLDDGESWSLVADHLPNTGSYEWHAPYTTSSNARMAVVLVEKELPEDLVEGVLGIGGKFSIGSTTGVGLAGVSFALHGATPHPARGTLRLSITLPDAGAATLALFDLAGRRVWAKDVGSYGAGKHVIEIGESLALPTGVYLVRLERGGQQLESRVVLVH